MHRQEELFKYIDNNEELKHEICISFLPLVGTNQTFGYLDPAEEQEVLLQNSAVGERSLFHCGNTQKDQKLQEFGYVS